MRNAISKFNGLAGVPVSRDYLEDLKNQAQKEGNSEIVSRITTLLENYPEAIDFELEIVDPVKESTDFGGLSFPDFQYLEYEEGNEADAFSGLGKSVSPNDVYQMITDKMIDLIKKANKKDYVRKWKTKGYLIAYNFETKKPYKGVNQMILSGIFEPISNPYYLTFKQVKELGGSVKKGSVGQEVIYYTKYEKEVARKVRDEFGKETGETLEVMESFYAIKYYNVFNGTDIDGIDFDLDNFNLAGKLENEIVTTGNNQPIEAADLIIKNFPKPQPTIHHGGNRAYFDPENDLIQLPNFQDFESSQDYYRTALHELSHSTMLPNRLNRNPDIADRKEYAFEELIAEFGAVFLSSQAGILFYTNKNHAAYLKGWNEALTQMKNDNKFFIKAAAAAQKIADYVLQYDENGNPLYLKTQKAESKKPKSEPVKARKRITKEKGLGFPNAPENPTVEQALAFAEKNLFGKSIYHRDIQKKVHFSKSGIKKAIAGKRGVSKIRLQLVFLAKDILKSSRLVTAESDKKQRKQVLQIFKLVAFKTINKIEYKVFVVLRQTQSGTLYYDHDAVKIRKHIKQTGDDSEKSNSTPLRLPNVFNAHEEQNEDTKNGLNSPNIEPNINDIETEVIILDAQPVQTVPLAPAPAATYEVQPVQPTKTVEIAKQLTPIEQEPPVQVINEISPKHKSLNYLMNNDEVNVLYDIPGDVGRFLGDVEIKPKESVVITLSSPQGGGKTRGILQFANAFAYNYRVKIFSLEEHVQSKLFKDKIAEYIAPANFERISVDSDLPNGIQTIHDSVADFDIILVDSWSKMLEIDKLINLDQDFRKKYDGKMFVFIFQQTSDGKMYGGAKNQFDGDIILFVEKFPDYRLSYIYPNKNRYTSTPLDQLKYNVFSRSLMKVESDQTVTIEQIEL